MSPDRHRRLARWAAACLGVDAIELREVLGGAGNVGFEVHDPGHVGGAVAYLRTKMGGEGYGRLGYTLSREGAILEAAGRLGFPVAPVLGTRGDPDALLLGFVPGVSRPGADEIERVAPKYLAFIAAVHASDFRLFPVEQHDTMRAAMSADLGAWTLEATDCRVIDEPLVALASRVLAERMPPGDGPPALVHGDVGAGNFLSADGEVTAILDWELTHLGDPDEDLAWLWIRGAHTAFGDPRTRFAEYESAASTTIDHDRLAWHLAFVMWKSLIALHGRLRAPVPGELAMVQLIVALTYDALLGAQLVEWLGGSTDVLDQDPRRSANVPAKLAEELLHVTDLTADRRVVLEYLRDSAALADWQRRELEHDCITMLGIGPDGLLGHVQSCRSDDLLAAATVIARAAERAAVASPRSLRRIERARRIGLGGRRPNDRHEGDDSERASLRANEPALRSSRSLVLRDLGDSELVAQLKGAPVSEPDPDWGLTTEDDDFHPRNDDPWWTETMWFAWMVPERGLLGYFYPMFRPNLGIQAGGVLVFDPSAELPWELPVFDYHWHQQIPAGCDLRDATLNNGMQIRCVEPTRRWELGFENRDLLLSLCVDGVTRPLVTRGTPPFNRGHIDQICHVTGTMVLHGETVPVDCLAMRDRSWGPRPDGRQPQVGYSYATHDEQNAWLAVTVGKRLDYHVTTGFNLVDGDWARMVSGTRTMERDTDGRPERYAVDALDELGRRITATGVMVSRQVFTAYPSMFCWNALVEWSMGGAQAWGEDQDCWHPRTWRKFVQEHRVRG